MGKVLVMQNDARLAAEVVGDNYLGRLTTTNLAG